MKNRSVQNKITYSAPVPERSERAGVKAPGRGRRLKFLRRVLCMLLTLSLLLNSSFFAMMEDELEFALADHEVEESVHLDDGGHLADLDSGDGLLSGEQNAYRYKLGKKGRAKLSTILKKLKLDLKLEDIEMVVAMGGGTVVLPDETVVEATWDLIYIEPLEDGDYRISALEDFQEAHMTVYTLDGGYYPITLENALQAKPTEADGRAHRRTHGGAH